MSFEKFYNSGSLCITYQIYNWKQDIIQEFKSLGNPLNIRSTPSRIDVIWIICIMSLCNYFAQFKLIFNVMVNNVVWRGTWLIFTTATVKYINHVLLLSFNWSPKYILLGWWFVSSKWWFGKVIPIKWKSNFSVSPT